MKSLKQFLFIGLLLSILTGLSFQSASAETFFLQVVVAPYPSFLTVYNGALYFSANGNDGAGTELWKYNSATNTASRVADIYSGASSSTPKYLAVYNGALYFSANGNDGAGTELWKYNSATNTASRVADIYSGASSSTPEYLAVYNGALYFSALGNNSTKADLWKYNSATNTASRVTELQSVTTFQYLSPEYLAVYNGALYFGGYIYHGHGSEIWTYNSVTNTASRVAAITGIFDPSSLTVYNGALYFSASTPASEPTPSNLWKYDSATNIASQLPIGSSSLPYSLSIYNGALYFGASGLWKYDSVTNSVSRPADTFPGTQLPSNPMYLTVYNGALYFSDGFYDLWKFLDESMTYTIYGNAGSPEATLNYSIDGVPQTAETDDSGEYSITVPKGWSGMVTPYGPGMGFTPASRSYLNLAANQYGQDYQVTSFIISGETGAPGVTLSYIDGTPKTVTLSADSDEYFITVPEGWSGTVTPYKPGVIFTPASRSYLNVTAPQNFQDFDAFVTLSGNAGVAGATLSYTDGTPKTVTADGNGNYTITLPYKNPWTIWSGTVTPSLVTDVFCPASQAYNSLKTSQTFQNYAHVACTDFDPLSQWTSSFDLSHGWTVADYVRTVGDVNDDGMADLVGFGQDGVYVATSTGTSFNPVSKWTSAFDLSHGWTVSSYVRTVGDVNGDGMADLVGFGQDGVYVALSNGSGFDPVSKWTSAFDLSHGWTVSQYVRTVGDVNNDGMADLVGFGQDGVYVALSTGTSFGAISKWTSAFDLAHGWTVSQYVRTVGDVNNDGMADLVGFGQDGVYVALSTGTGFAAMSKWVNAFDLSHGWTVSQFVRTVGDINGDGRADLVGFGQDGVYVSLSMGNMFSLPSRRTTSFDLSHGWTVAQFVRTVGDISGDGKADIAGFGQDGVYISVAQ